VNQGFDPLESTVQPEHALQYTRVEIEEALAVRRFEDRIRPRA
jgi:hypothetical protein